MVATLRCRYGESIDLKKAPGHDRRIPQGSTVSFNVEILDTESEDWSAYSPRSEFRKNFRDKAPTVLATAQVSWLRSTAGANKKFFVRLESTDTDAMRIPKGSWDIEIWHEQSVLRPVSESVWVLSPQTTE